MDDTYLGILAALEGDATPAAGLVMGKVTSVAPLKVLVGGNTMEQDELLCNPGLLGGTRQIKGKLTGSGSVGDSAGAASLTVEGDLEPKDPIWTVGDELLMLPIEEAQRYVIICKVVEL